MATPPTGPKSSSSSSSSSLSSNLSVSTGSSSASSIESLHNTPDEEKLFTAIREGDVATIEDLIKTQNLVDVNATREVYSGDTPAHIAVLSGQIASLDKLAELGADLTLKNGDEHDDETLMAVAVRAKDDNVAMVERILHLCGKSVLQDKTNDETMVWKAAFNENPKILKLLLDKGCMTQLNIPDNFKTTPLNAACLSGCAEVVKLLLEAGADVTVPEQDGGTCLHTAFDDIDILLPLIQSGKCTSIYKAKNKRGKTALDIAEESLRDVERDDDYSAEDRAKYRLCYETLKQVTK